jgi:tRNA-modifying protein YgfZ
MSSPEAPAHPWLDFLAARGARVVDGRVADFGQPGDELRAARDGTLLADLSHNALLSVTGDDAIAFLHAQFTNDVQSLSPGQAQWNGWCSAKGRLLATFLLVRRPEGAMLMLPAEIAAAVAKRLGMYVLRSKVKIADAGAAFVRLGLAGKAAADAVARAFGEAPAAMASVERDGATCIALDATRFVVLAPVDKAPQAWEALSAAATPGGVDPWTWTTIRAGIPRIVAATQEAFVPQMANFDLVGGVSFRKGCYPGQEIVARTQYRGILKRRMALAHAEGGERPLPGHPVYSASFGDQAAGEVVDAAPAPDGGWDLLAVAQVEALRQRDLRLASPEGPALRILSHPAADAA